MFKKISIIGLILVFSISLIFVGCGQKDTKDQKTDGNNSEGLSGNLKLAGSTSVQPLAEELAMRFMDLNPNVKIDVAGGGSGAGVESAGNGAADIGMASRNMKDEEKTNYPDLKPLVIANDGIVVIVHPENKIADLTKEQIKAIFKGEITNWEKLGEEKASITVINREEGSGTRGAFQEIVLGKEEFTEKAAIQNSTGAVKEAIKSDKNAIGYISMGSLSNDVSGVKIDGVEPSVEEVKTGMYPIARPFNFIIKGEAQDLAKDFITWILSGEAQALIEEEGFISAN